MPPDATTYVSIDTETDGLCPGIHSMLQLGSVAVRLDGEELGAFTANLLPLPDATPLQSTMDWWKERPEVYAKVTENAEDPAVVMQRYDTWLRTLPQPTVLVGYPAEFDAAFVNYYEWRFVGKPPYAHGALDLKTLAMTLLKQPYYDCYKKNWPERWFPPSGIHVHLALDDAREQAYEFLAMMRELRA